MIKRCQVILLLLGLPAIGCQRPFLHSQIELINAEKRALEDELYALQFEYEDALRKIEKLQRQNERTGGGSGAPGRDDRPSGSGSRTQGSPVPDIDLSPPLIEEGVPIEPRIEMPLDRGTSESASPVLPAPRSSTTPPTRSPVPPEPPRSTLPPSTPSSTQSPSRTQSDIKSVEVPTRILSLDPADPRVTQLHLNPVHTKGSDFDHQPGDDGLTVVVEPRNRDDTFVPLAGPISVLILDPTKSAEEGRVLARWEIDANEAQRLLKNTASVRGIELKLAWPDKKPPATNRVELHVRYLTVDHRDLRAQRELFLTLPGQVTQRWTPRAVTHHAASEPATPAPHAPTAPTTPTETARPDWRPYR
jgi:hypothetical protein